MKLIVEAGFPLEPFNTYVREGVARERIGRLRPLPDRHLARGPAVGGARAVRVGLIGGTLCSRR
jgi:hypothetical protein